MVFMLQPSWKWTPQNAWELEVAATIWSYQTRGRLNSGYFPLKADTVERTPDFGFTGRMSFPFDLTAYWDFSYNFGCLLFVSRRSGSMKKPCLWQLFSAGASGMLNGPMIGNLMPSMFKRGSVPLQAHHVGPRTGPLSSSQEVSATRIRVCL